MRRRASDGATRPRRWRHCSRGHRIVMVLVAVAVMFAGVPTATAQEDEPDLSAPLAGSSDLVVSGAFPSVGLVAVSYPDGRTGQCTGTLVAPQWVLTAAHCVMNPTSAGPVHADDAVVILGSVDVRGDLESRPSGVEIHEVIGWSFPSDHIFANGNVDAALIRLASPSAHTPMPLASDRALVQPAPGTFTAAGVLGFGRSQCAPSGCEPSDLRLRAGTTRIIADADAERALGIQLSADAADKLLFTLPASERDALICSGDSGGPLVVLQDGELRLAAVISFSINDPNCVADLRLEGFTDVVGSDVRPWIEEMIDASEFVCGSTEPDIEGTNRSEVIVVVAPGQTVIALGGADEVRFSSGSNLACLGSGDDRAIGGSGPDVLSGESGSDRLLGGSGADRLLGGSGRDRLEGGSGGDTISGGSAADVLLGGSGSDRLDGNTGNDEIHGGGGADDIAGGGGHDVIRAGSGRDDVSGGPGRDHIDGGTGHDKLNGNNGSDRIYGKRGKDRIDGGDGDDRLFGGSHNDVILGGGGGDRANGGGGSDACSAERRSRCELAVTGIHFPDKR